MKAGRDTAVTYIARPMTNWGDDPIRQQYVLQMSFYSKTIIKNKRNVQSLPNVFLVCDRSVDCCCGDSVSSVASSVAMACRSSPATPSPRPATSPIMPTASLRCLSRMLFFLLSLCSHFSRNSTGMSRIWRASCHPCSRSRASSRMLASRTTPARSATTTSRCSTTSCATLTSSGHSCKLLFIHLLLSRFISRFIFFPFLLALLVCGCVYGDGSKSWYTLTFNYKVLGLLPQEQGRGQPRGRSHQRRGQQPPL